MAPAPSLVSIVLGLAGGLAIFLYGLTLLADALKTLGNETMKRLLARATGNRWAGVGVGAVATTILDSSSATLVLVVGLVHAGLLNVAGAISVALGANIGTTISSQVFALGLMKYGAVLLVVGVAAHMLVKGERKRSWASLVIAMGLVFFGLEHMGHAAEPLQKMPAFDALMTSLRTPLYGVLVGAAVTAVIQSSSATVGMVVVLASQGAIPVEAGIAVMLGAEIGTCTDVLFASLGRSRQAVRVAVFQLLFNVTTVTLGVLAIGPLTRAAGVFSSSPARQIANAHVLFNVVGVLLFIGFVPLLARVLERVIPDRAEPD